MLFDLRPRRSIVLVGARRIGKTVLLRQIVNHVLDGKILPADQVCFVPIDRLRRKELDILDLVDHFAFSCDGNPALLVLDEISFLDSWQLALKILVDKYRNITFLAAGSALSGLKQRSEESGHGRFIEIHLPPLSFYEFLLLTKQMPEQLCELDDEQILKARLSGAAVEELNSCFLSYLNHGSYPELVFSPSHSSQYLRETVKDHMKLIYQVFMERYGIRKEGKLGELLRYLVEHNGNELQLKTICSELASNKITVSKYIEFLAICFLIVKVGRYHGRHRKEVSGRKKYCLENSSFFSIAIKELTFGDVDFGKVAEAAMFVQNSTFAGFETQYLRERANRRDWEVDLAHLDRSRRPVRLAEVKWSESTTALRKAAVALQRFGRKYELGKEALYCTTRKSYGPEEKGQAKVNYLPTAQYCLALGRLGMMRFNMVAGVKQSGSTLGPLFT